MLPWSSCELALISYQDCHMLLLTPAGLWRRVRVRLPRAAVDHSRRGERCAVRVRVRAGPGSRLHHHGGGDGVGRGPSSTTVPRSWVVFKSPSHVRTTFSACSNHQRRLTLWRRTAAPTATSCAYVLTLQFLWQAAASATAATATPAIAAAAGPVRPPKDTPIPL